MTDRTSKRVRTNEADERNENNENNAQRRMSPTKAAEQALVSSIESLHSSLHPLLHHFGRKIIEVRSKAFNKCKMKKKLEEDPTYIPKSCRASDFKITLSKAAIDSSSERVTFLEGQANQAKEAYQATLRTVVTECIEVEIKSLGMEEKSLTADLLESLAKATSTLAGTTDTDAHLRVTNLVELDKGLFKYSPVTTHASVREMYALHHSVTMPAATLRIAVIPRDATPEDAAARHCAAARSLQRDENKEIQTFRKAVESILIIPQKAFLRTQEENDTAIALKKMATELVDGKATEATAMQLDAEGSASFEQLQDLIKKEVAKRDKKLNEIEKSYEKLKKELAAATGKQSQQKNESQRGQRGASNKNKSTDSSKATNKANSNSNNKVAHERGRKRSNGRQNRSKTPERKRHSSQQNATVDDNNNATGNGKQNNKGRRSRSQSTRKRSNSRKGRQRSPK